jgi:hypothetical protein
VHYQLTEVTVVVLELPEGMEDAALPEGAEEEETPSRRFLVVERRFGRVGYAPLLADLFSLVTPSLRLMGRVVGHKSARRTVYSVRAGVPLEQRRRLVFGWLRDFVNKNADYNFLRRNSLRKPPSKRLRLRPERSRRLTRSFYPRLNAELRRVVEGDEPVLEQLRDFDLRVGHLRPARSHFRWDVLSFTDAFRLKTTIF